MTDKAKQIIEEEMMDQFYNYIIGGKSDYDFDPYEWEPSYDDIYEGEYLFNESTDNSFTDEQFQKYENEVVNYCDEIRDRVVDAVLSVIQGEIQEHRLNSSFIATEMRQFN